LNGLAVVVGVGFTVVVVGAIVVGGGFVVVVVGGVVVTAAIVIVDVVVTLVVFFDVLQLQATNVDNRSRVSIIITIW
jgi:hypothetical protein